jgi:diadenosine tetraphosphate (Ap4A) HIT family hydrolase
LENKELELEADADLEQPVVKRLAKATEAENFNVLQNNGRIAHQEVDHVHFHMVSRPVS